MRICIDLNGNTIDNITMPESGFDNVIDAPACSTRYTQAINTDFMSLIVVIVDNDPVGYCSFFTFDDGPKNCLDFCIDYIYLNKDLRGGSILPKIAELVFTSLTNSNTNYKFYIDRSDYLNNGGAKFGQTICNYLISCGLKEK